MKSLILLASLLIIPANADELIVMESCKERVRIYNLETEPVEITIICAEQLEPLKLEEDLPEAI